MIGKEDTLNNQNKMKYDAEYISYVNNGDSAVVFIVRDIVKSINTAGMWIDVIKTSGYKNKFNKWDFSNITIELFPRKTKPIYPQYVSDEYKKYITYLVFRYNFLNSFQINHKTYQFYLKQQFR